LDIFEEFKVETVCMPLIDDSFKPTTAIYKNLLSAIKNEQSRTLELCGGTAVVEKENYNVTTLSPGSNSIYSDLNDYSLTLLVNCYSNTILFTGDAEKPAELDMLSSKINLDADILKVGHHGSGNSSTQDFLNAVTPQVSVISCGKGNTYGHPHDDAVERLGKIGSKVFRTDTVGTVIAKCYDGGFNIETNTDIKLDGNK
jgi:competence protein ComEC